jgi:hypothetical protein
MRKEAVIIGAAIIIQIILAGVLIAQDEWEMNIKAKCLNAENRLVIGQRPDASDVIDGRYDVPALLSDGLIKAYMELEGGQYWKDIKKTCSPPCSKTWNIHVESEDLGEIIELSWDPVNIPGDTRMILIDQGTGRAMAMNLEPYVYTYENPGRREFVVEVQKW